MGGWQPAGVLTVTQSVGRLNVHATAYNVWGFSDGASIPYLTID
jgi:hypothetical protein